MDQTEQLAAQNELIIVLIAVGVAILGIIWYLQRTQRFDISPERFTRDDSLIVLIVLAAIGVSIRIALAYNMPGYPSDMNCFRAWSSSAYNGGLDHFYDGEFFADYPPLYVYVLAFLGWIQSATNLNIMGPDYAVVLRLPSIIAEVLIGLFVYHITIRRWGKNTALTLSALILLNPALMMNSSVWGQIDSIAALIAIGVFYLVYNKKYIWSAALFVLGFLLKPQMIIIGPVLLYAFIENIALAKDKKRAWADLGISIAVMIAVWFIVPLPFGIGRDPMWLADLYRSTMGEYTYATLNSFNIYGLAGLNFIDVSQTNWLGLPVSTWGFIFVAVLCVFCAWLMWKNRSRWFVFVVAGLLAACVFTFVHGMHERYLYSAPFLLLIAYILGRDARLLDCAVMYFGLIMVNEGVALTYYEQWVPQALMSGMSILSIGMCAYLIYTVSSIALRGAEVQKLKVRDALPDLTRDQAIRARLERPLGYRKCDGKDALIILIICAIYSLVAFTNLGSFDIPQTSATTEGDTIIEFADVEHISQFKYYADYGEGTFDVLYSTDGQYYQPLPMSTSNGEVTSIDHALGNLYKWQVYDTNVDAKYIQITCTGNPLPIMEVAFFGPDENQIIPVSVTREGQPMVRWTDEQDIVPYEPTYMTDFYFDEIYHVRTAYENIHLMTPYEITHPPLGKVLLAIGIEIFGMNAFGWRFMGTLAGVMMIPVMYVMVREMIEKRKYAVFACVLLCADFMHFAQTRIGTVDSYSILWIMAMYLFMYRYTKTNFNRQPYRKTIAPLFFSGMFFGIGAATKWLCLYGGLGLLAIYVILLVERYQEYRYALKTGEYPEIVKNFKANFWKTILCGFLFFIVMPACIYLASYTPYTLVTDGGAYGLQEIIGNQSYMLNYHANLNPDHVHPFASKWYTWPVDVRPVLFFSNQTDTTIATLSTMGNPFLWWTGLFAMASVIVMGVRHKKYRQYGLMLALIGLLAEFMPWWFITREVFIYHYFAVVPFLIIFVVFWLKFLEDGYRWGKIFGYAYVSVAVAFFAIFYPVITGVPAPKDYINSIRWLQSWPFY